MTVKLSSFSHLLIANRGEIAVRIIRTAHRLGIKTTAVYSEADRLSLHVREADNAVPIGGSEPAASYLRIENILEAARSAGAEAIHPGYGFLAENADFAEACAKAGLVFVGPPANAIRLMGNKRAAKQKMIEAGVPVIPGFEKTRASDEELAAAAGRVGYPLMVKAASGGGGRGMRRVDGPDDLKAAIASARGEAKAAFGDDELILERMITGARHVEVQVFADNDGNVIHLGERDCSIQRRHQKIVEETPCPVVDDDLRDRMGKTACDAARSIGYLGAGTVEFLLSGEGEFYFMEMNTRLQVEHPVTECVTGLDLVEMQLDVARGLALSLTQSDVAFNGHAIEARLCAESVADGFLPQTGRVLHWSPAPANLVRTDSGIAKGSEVSPYYDSLLAKIIAHGKTREEALDRLDSALRNTTLLGVTSNRGLLLDIIGNKAFRAGSVSTTFFDNAFPADDLQKKLPDDATLAAMAALLFSLRQAEDYPLWTGCDDPAWPLAFQVDGDAHDARVTIRDSSYQVRIAERSFDLDRLSRSDHTVRFQSAEGAIRLTFAVDGSDVHVGTEAGESFVLAGVSVDPASAEDVEADGAALAPMGGDLEAVLVEVGEAVTRGQPLFVVSAMKMQHTVNAPGDGVVETVNAAPGDQVSARQVVVMLATS